MRIAQDEHASAVLRERLLAVLIEHRVAVRKVADDLYELEVDGYVEVADLPLHVTWRKISDLCRKLAASGVVIDRMKLIEVPRHALN